MRDVGQRDVNPPPALLGPPSLLVPPRPPPRALGYALVPLSLLSASSGLAAHSLPSSAGVPLGGCWLDSVGGLCVHRICVYPDLGHTCLQGGSVVCAAACVCSVRGVCVWWEGVGGGAAALFYFY